MPGWEKSKVAIDRLEALEKYDSLIDCVMDGVTDNIDYHALTMEAIHKDVYKRQAMLYMLF